MANELTEQQTTSLQIHNGNDYMMGLNELKTRANMVTNIKREIMRENVHWGKVPGCGDKPTLLKNGAELLCMAFKLAPDAKVEIADLGNGHREYTVTTTLTSIVTGTPIATGLGSCSTMESKYRYRNVSDFERTGLPIPPDSKERKAEYRKQGYGMKKIDGNWEWVRFKDNAKVENPDIADTYNTVLKMASKRSLVDATLKATGGSCEFTQDIEDMQTSEYASYEDVTPTQHKKQAPATAIDEETKQFMDGMQGLWKQSPEVYKATMADFGFKSANSVPPKRRSEVFNTIVANVAKSAKPKQPKSAPTAKEQNLLWPETDNLNGEESNG